MPIILGARDMPAQEKGRFVISLVLTSLGILILIAAIVCVVLIFTRHLDWYIPVILAVPGLVCIGVSALMQRGIADRLDKASH